jgi:hypothetical protein
MKKWIIGIIALLSSVVLLIIFSEKDEQILGDNYYYLPKYEAKDVGYPGGGIIYKSNQKYSFTDIKINGNVVEVHSNDDFIIAIQNSDTSYLESKHKTVSKANTPLYYYIINKKSDIVYGPFNNTEYLNKCEEIGVSLELKFQY